MATISVGILAHRDAAEIARAIGSVRAIAAEILVFDAPGTNTAEAAVAAGARIVGGIWRDDFADAWNQLHAAATGDWFFRLNPDEVLLPRSIEPIQSAAEDPTMLGYRLQVAEVWPGQPIETAVSHSALRLYRRRADWQYRGRIHPVLVPNAETFAGSLSMNLQDVQATILKQHAKADSAGKQDFRERILRAALQDDPSDIGISAELAVLLLGKGPLDGAGVIAQTVQLLQPHLAAVRAPAGSLGEFLAIGLQGKLETALGREKCRELAERWFGQSPPMVWALAGAANQRQDFASAEIYFRQLLRMGQTGEWDSSSPFDPVIVGPAALLSLGYAVGKQGRIAEAKAFVDTIRADGDPRFQKAAEDVLTLLCIPFDPRAPQDPTD
ncbi:MAG: glycosyltransferase [Gemmataceae bacterium]